MFPQKAHVVVHAEQCLLYPECLEEPQALHEVLVCIPVIMVSGVDEAGSVARCIQKGAAGHLAKPIDSMRLANLIAECMADLTPT